MTQKLRDCNFEERYETSSSDLVARFYVPALNCASTYDRAVGYFRSSVFHLSGVALSEFALRNGRMRLICSPYLDTDDKNVLRQSYAISDEQLNESIKSDIKAAIQDVAEHAALQLLATLLKFRILDIRLTYKPNAVGIFHSKVGIICDGTDTLSFDGSANETYMAWAENEERIVPFCSWHSEYQMRQVGYAKSYFEDLWNSRRPGLKTRPLPEMTETELQRYALQDPEAAIEKVRLTAKTAPSPNTGRAKRKRTLQTHQAASRSNWWKVRRGIVSYVTGGGKTFIALEILNDWFGQYDKASVIILVPSDLLAKQWYRALKSEEPELSILQVGGERSDGDWRQRLSDYTRAARTNKRRVVLSVMKSAASDDFLRLAQVGSHSLLIADEVHKVGAIELRKSLTLRAGGRLGLSATPERFRDPDGTRAIFDYFGEKIEPEFTINDALKSDPPRLVPYFYEPAVVFLTATERDEYVEMSKRIRRLAGQAATSGSPSTQENLTRALILRARILKGAEGKPAFAATMLTERFRDGDRWLIYCDDRQQIDNLQALLQQRGLKSLEYTSAMSFSKSETIRHFEDLGGILLAIECLDEGIDIPSITHALILASSTNPRQHIQRRGRVLRKAPNKISATICDTLVAPDARVGRIVFDHDLARAREFAADATNRGTAERYLDSLTSYEDTDGSPWEDFEDDAV